MFNLKSLIQDHSLFSLLKMQNICILITKIVLQIINPSSADYILTLKFKTKAELLFEKNNVRVLSKASWDQVQLLSGKKVAFIHNWSSKKGAKSGRKI